MNILKRANNIVRKRSEEGTRKYGNFIKSMSKAAQIASIMTGTELSTRQAYAILVGLKLAREGVAHKEDNLLDAVAYLGSLNDFEEAQEQPKPKRRKPRWKI